MKELGGGHQNHRVRQYIGFITDMQEITTTQQARVNMTCWELLAGTRKVSGGNPRSQAILEQKRFGGNITQMQLLALTISQRQLQSVTNLFHWVGKTKEEHGGAYDF